MSTNRSRKKRKLATQSELIDEFTKAIKSNPKDASAFLNRGAVYHQQGNYDLAIIDYTKAIQLKPEYAGDWVVKSYYDAALNSLNNRLNAIPEAVSVHILPFFLDKSDLDSLSQTSKANTKLFKPALAFKKLLHLVVRYELNEEKILGGLAANVNPILQEVNALLTKDPSLALKRDYTTDQSGRNKYWSPLEAAYWSGNWELCNMMIERTQSAGMGAAAEEQLLEWDKQAYNYGLILMRAEGDTFPLLKKIPALIKQYNEDGEDKIFQWGDVNGKWQLTELEGDTKELFANLDFPNNSSNDPITMTSKEITRDMYNALKKGHTVAHFDLDEYVRVTTTFVNKYPTNVQVPEAQLDECDSDSYKIGKAQKKFPAWLAAVWCSNIPFSPLPDFKLLIKAPETCRLKLYSNEGEDFFADSLGSDFSIYKGSEPLCFGVAARPSAGDRYAATLDVAAMAALSEVITEELGKSMQLLPRESKSTPGLSSG